MAFFEDLGKKITQKGQSAVQKTKEMAEITMLNGRIADEEKRIKDTYTEIGKLYVSLHPGDYEEDYHILIEALKHSDTKISEYKQQIQNIRCTKRCKNCGAEIALHALVCDSCGKPVQEADQIETVILDSDSEEEN